MALLELFVFVRSNLSPPGTFASSSANHCAGVNLPGMRQRYAPFDVVPGAFPIAPVSLNRWTASASAMYVPLLWCCPTLKVDCVGAATHETFFPSSGFPLLHDGSVDIAIATTCFE